MARYTLTFADGITSIGAWQAMNFNQTTGEFDGGDVITVDTIAQARDEFARLAREAGRDGTPTEQGGPWADLYPSPTLTPDDEPFYRFTIGPRYGVRQDRV